MPRGGQLSNRVLERYLLPRERIVVATRRHWGKILEPIATTILGFLVVGFVAGLAGGSLTPVVTLLWIAWLGLAARGAWEVFEWRYEWFVATEKRLLLVYGLITHKVAMMPIRKVTDMNYVRSPIGRVLGYGTFVLESAGQDQAMHTITWVTHPDETYRKLCDTLFGPDGEDPEDGPMSKDGDAAGTGAGGDPRRPNDPGDDEPDVIDPDLLASPWDPPAPRAMPPVPAPPPPAVPPTTRRASAVGRTGQAGRASGPTMELAPGERRPTPTAEPRPAPLGSSGTPGREAAEAAAAPRAVPLSPAEAPRASAGRELLSTGRPPAGVRPRAEPPADDGDGWTVSDEARAPFVRIAPRPHGRHTREEPES